MYVRADYIRRVSRLWKGKWRHDPFWPAKEKRCSRIHRYDFSYCRSAAAPVELIYEVFANFHLKKQKKHLSFLSSSPASLDLSDLPRFLMPSPIPVLPLVFKPLCRKTRTLMDSGIRRNPRRFKEIAVWDRTCDRGVSVENFSTSPNGDCILTRNSLGERESRKIKLYHNEKYKRCMKTLFTNFYKFFRDSLNSLLSWQNLVPLFA